MGGAKKQSKPFTNDAPVFLSRLDLAGIPAERRSSTLDDLDTSHPSASQMVSRARAYIATDDWRRQGDLYLWGKPGNGKTHTAYTIAIEAIRQRVWPVRYWSVSELYAAIKASFDHETESPLGDACDAKLLVLDDVAVSASTPWVQEQFYRISDYRYANKLPTIYTSNVPPSGLKALFNERVVSRILERSAPVLAMDGPDFRLQGGGQ